MTAASRALASTRLISNGGEEKSKRGS
jgi:hypothetical protein